jgi:hypothetical protein
LRAGVIELARLADDDRAGADDEDAVNVGSFWHLKSLSAETLRTVLNAAGWYATQPKSGVWASRKSR